MKTLLVAFTLVSLFATIFFAIALETHAATPPLTVPQGGTGWGGWTTGTIPIGPGTGSTALRFATSSGLTYATSSNTLTATNLIVSTAETLGSLTGLIAGNSGVLYQVASSSLFGFTPASNATTLTINGTSQQITSSAGAQDLSANRTWTLSLPNHVKFPVDFEATAGSTTNATSTSLYITGITSKLLKTDSSGQVLGAANGTDYTLITAKTCTNQALTALTAAGVGTCSSITDSFLSGAVGIAHGGTGSTTAPISQLLYGGSSAYQSVATSSFAVSSSFSYSGTLGALVGGAGGTLSIANGGVSNAMLANSTISGVALGGTLNSLSHDTTLSGTSYNGSAAVSDWGLNLAHANTFTALQQFNGNASSTLFSTLGPLTIGTTSTTTIWGNATSSFSGGINLANGGCFAVGGTCLSSGGSAPGGSGTEIQFRAGASTFGALTPSAYASGPNHISFGTTTAQLGVLTLGSSTEPQLVISDNIAGDNNYYLRTIANSLFLGTSTTATSTTAVLQIDSSGSLSLPFSGTGTHPNISLGGSSAGGISNNSGTLTLFEGGISTLSITNALVQVHDAGSSAVDLANSSDTGTGLNWVTTGSNLAFVTNNAEAFRITPGTYTGFGTTTPHWLLQLASSTAPQLTLSDGSASSNHFSWRAINNWLFLGTSSPSTFATSTFPILTVSPGGEVGVQAQQPATSTAITLDWKNSSNQIEYQIGTSATTITLINATTSDFWGSTKRVWVCNPGSTAGALTWVGVEWIGTAPSQTTTASKCDLYSFNVTRATSTSAYKVAGAGSTGFQ